LNSRTLAWLAAAAFQVSPFLVGSARLDSAGAQAKPDAKPATKEQQFTYALMSLETFCTARRFEIDFKKSVSVALAAEASFIVRRHDFKVEGLDKPLTKQQLEASLLNRLVLQAVTNCPEFVPNDIKNNVKKKMEEIKKRNKKP
jgi:hypothetical protein